MVHLSRPWAVQKRPYERIDCCDCCFVMTGQTRSFLVYVTFFLRQRCVADLVKHLSPYTGFVSERMGFVPSNFSHRKLITECRFLLDAFSGSVYKRRHSEVIITELTPDDQNYISYKMHLSDLFIFHILKKINRMAPFCNFLWNTLVIWCWTKGTAGTVAYNIEDPTCAHRAEIWCFRLIVLLTCMLSSGLSQCFIFKEFVNWKSKSNTYVVFVCEKIYVWWPTFYSLHLRRSR